MRSGEKVWPRVALAAALASGSAGAFAQPDTPPPAPGRPGAADPLELLPAIGKIGASVGVRGGWGRQPFELGQGGQASTFLRLPLKEIGGGVLSYEITIGYAQSTSDPFFATSAVAFVANLAATGRGDAGPFPVRRLVRSEGRIVTVEPASLVYARSVGRARPYVAVGAGVAVVLTKEIPEADESRLFTGTGPFDAPLIGGQISQSVELEALGRPSGQGNVEPVGHVGAGIEIRLTPGASLQADYRFSKMSGRRGSMHAASFGIGVHF